MKDKLNTAFDNVDDEYIAKTSGVPKKSRATKIAVIAAALAAVVVVSFSAGALLSRIGKNGITDPVNTDRTPEDTKQAETKSDETEEEPDVTQEPFKGETGNYSGAKYVSLADPIKKMITARHDHNFRMNEYNEYCERLASFYDELSGKLLSGDKSSVISPVNIYMSLSLLAECTDGNSRKEILDVIGAENIEQLRGQTKTIWAMTCRDSTRGKSILTNSIWIDSDMQVKDRCAEYLKNEHMASAFNGDFSDPMYINALKQWLSDMTDGLLDNCINELDIPPDTLAVLASTLYYKARWYNEYHETEYGKFNGVDCIFNVKKEDDSLIYKGDGFTAYRDLLSDGNYMWFFLPDEGKTAADVLNVGLISYIDIEEKDCTKYDVTIRMPDFDVDYNENIIDKIAKLGINECMDINKADFSALTDGDLYVGEIIHAARFKADKKGVEGAAYTVGTLLGLSEPRDKYDFNLDRPFVFVVENNGTPLFVGVVNEI
ncbi:MAG: hypothetical protein J5879_05070 [Clostridia bacterium]|nr:hypothetical protein [Clostridia bacterium]